MPTASLVEPSPAEPSPAEPPSPEPPQPSPTGEREHARSVPVSAHLLPDTAKLSLDGSLVIGGVGLLDIANGYGTPTLVYDQQHIEARCQEALDVFPDGAAYAAKAFLCKEMVRVVLAMGMKIDVATGGEMHVALAAGATPADLIFHGNNKSYNELVTAISLGIDTIVIDSFDEIDRIEHICASLANVTPVSCLIRVTPGMTGDTHHHIRTGQDDSKFGFNVATGIAQQGIDRLRSSKHFDLRGIHSHIGSQILDTAPFVAAATLLADFVNHNGFNELCVGGGIGVAYVNRDHAPTINEWGTAVQKALTAAGLNRNVKVTAEPGRSIVANAAVTLYTVGTLKTIPGIRTYLSVDGGMSDNPRPALYGANYEAFLPRKPFAEREQEVTIAGKHCESGDLLVKSAFIPTDIQLNDVLAIPVTGAYGYAMASNYNRMTKPAVVFVNNGSLKLVARRETYDDLLRLEV